MCNAHNHSFGCRCGWGGEGHLGGPPNWDRAYQWKHRDEDFCRQTTCRKCGEPVFFVRHNGGSVWFDTLGWPWPKHPCHEEERYAIALRRTLEELRATGRSDRFGVILSCQASGEPGIVFVEVRIDSSRVLDAMLELDSDDLPGLAGALVTVEYDGDIPVATVVEPMALKNVAYIQVVEVRTGNIVDEFPYPQRDAASARLRALDLQYPGQYRLSQVKRLE